MKLSVMIFIKICKAAANLLYQVFSYINKLIRRCSKEDYLTDF